MMVQKNIVHIIRNIQTSPKRGFNELNHHEKYRMMHFSEQLAPCNETYKPIIPREDLAPNIIHNIDCQHYYRGQLVLSLDYESISVKEEEFSRRCLFVKYDGKKLSPVAPTYHVGSRRFCFCAYACEKCVCSHNDRAAEDKSFCECLEAGRVKTANLAYTIYSLETLRYMSFWVNA